MTGATVLLATYNGAATLLRVLEAHTLLEAPRGGWRLVVIDNASTDDTPAILSRYAGRLPLTVLRTGRRGKNLALNLGLQHASGDLVVFTDDDAPPAPDWLAALCRCAAEQPDYDIFGGRIEALWPHEPPEWIGRLVNLGATFAITPAGLASGPIPAAQAWGANMAIRRRVFDQGQRFDEGVGPAAGNYVMGSEVEFTGRLERLGHRAWFCAQARVGHFIRPHQLSREWIVGRAYRLGRHMFHQERPALRADERLLLGAPRWKYRRLLDEQLRRLLARLRRDHDAAFTADWEAALLRGYLHEARQATRSAP
ncbi:glycosyltransferase family 2 protein [Pseudothauera nasutitermitis]|uniref:Glycosyltransferase family 2 protein n=1 Tax=Pseudothauera nasutitermitis TaxID=2565930 RepID=A0A4S4AUS4_9RHOO|nr:glycosyltransferase family 2 protein [Pseudothauera nasutitermitis]THF63648.1 glycosyltransferase family 2 protein [Pseudothauera nasutitermitis]